jgi:ABC-type dipeptide/oligopeptide/nickel transport system ATPase component
MSEPLLAVENLSLSFPAPRGERVRVLDGVSFDVRRSETVALVGESGSGKTVTALAIVGVGDRRARIDAGRILLEGDDLLRFGEDERRAYRGKRISIIFQSPKASLNPLVTVGEQIARVVMLHRGLRRKAAVEAALELMAAVGIDDVRRRYGVYAHQLSGGMAQRILIAMALAAEPELLIADEPTTGLDVTIQQQIFAVLFELQQRLQMAILLITHDLALVAETCDRVAVMQAGRVVEKASVEQIFREPKHPYTQRLLGSVLRADRRVEPAIGPGEGSPATR